MDKRPIFGQIAETGSKVVQRDMKNMRGTAISLIRGVSSVTLKRRRKTSMDRAIEDIEQGRVYKYDSLDDLIKEIEG